MNKIQYYLCHYIIFSHVGAFNLNYKIINQINNNTRWILKVV